MGKPSENLAIDIGYSTCMYALAHNKSFQIVLENMASHARRMFHRDNNNLVPALIVVRTGKVLGCVLTFDETFCRMCRSLNARLFMMI
jgi:hypothetical protein